MLARQAAAAVGVGTCWHEKLLLRCRLLGLARRFGAHGGREQGGGAYRGGRPPTTCYYYIRPQAVIQITFYGR